MSDAAFQRLGNENMIDALSTSHDHLETDLDEPFVDPSEIAEADAFRESHGDGREGHGDAVEGESYQGVLGAEQPQRDVHDSTGGGGSW